MAFVHILHDGDLELAGQQQDGKAGKNDEREPISGPCRVESEELDQLRRRRGPLKDVPQTVEEAVAHEDPHGHESDQLDHGLEGHRGDHTLVALRGVQVARAEEDGEDGHHRRDGQGGVGPACRPFADGGGKDDVEARRHGF